MTHGVTGGRNKDETTSCSEEFRLVVRVQALAADLSLLVSGSTL